MNNYWFTSDTHFGHRFMADLRGFDPYNHSAGLREHDELLIERWNERVAPDDTVFHLGDFSFQNREAMQHTFDQLNGHKHLIVGNHDNNKVLQLGWDSINDLATVSIEGQKYVLCHYPMLTWHNAHHGVYHLHGHTHGNLRAPDSTRMDIGVDLSPNLAPFSVDTIRQELDLREYDFIDHHDGGKAFKDKNAEVTPWPTQR